MESKKFFCLWLKWQMYIKIKYSARPLDPMGGKFNYLRFVHPNRYDR